MEFSRITGDIAQALSFSTCVAQEKKLTTQGVSSV
jgi:hypothetical protein